MNWSWKRHPLQYWKHNLNTCVFFRMGCLLFVGFHLPSLRFHSSILSIFSYFLHQIHFFSPFPHWLPQGVIFSLKTCIITRLWPYFYTVTYIEVNGALLLFLYCTGTFLMTWYHWSKETYIPTIELSFLCRPVYTIQKIQILWYM